MMKDSSILLGYDFDKWYGYGAKGASYEQIYQQRQTAIHLYVECQEAVRAF